ncbi:malonate decarboxylase subunit epsilon [Neisseriaceae bacterium TC5R-5]|nr:malonate decarboxylase subunit epsilon [Neisseriaceae bacterium TC5R-5]
MSLLLTFPGQGAQRAGMLHTLPEHPLISETLAQASEVLQQPVLELDSEQALHSTRAVQLCLLIAGVAMARLLLSAGVPATMVAGFSIGAWPAAVVAGVVDFAAALRLVALRGELMQAAFPSGYGMLAIQGLRQPQLEALLLELHQPAAPLYLANLNSDTQFVIAGEQGALARLNTAAHAAGAQACHRLAMSVPSHCPLLQAAAEQLRQAMQHIVLQAPRLLYLSSSRARVLFTAAQIADDLAMNMARQVRWGDSMRHAWERGIRTAWEMPPGQVLTGLTRPVFIDGHVLAVDGQAWQRLVLSAN